MEFRTYFVYFHTFSSKFKVQRTPTEFGPPVVPAFAVSVGEKFITIIIIIICFFWLKVTIGTQYVRT